MLRGNDVGYFAFTRFWIRGRRVLRRAGLESRTCNAFRSALRQSGGRSRKAIYSARETEIEMPYDPVQFSRVELSSRRGSLPLFSGRVSFQAALSDSRPCHSTSRCAKRPDWYAAFQIFSRRRSAELWRLMDDRRLGTFLRHSGNLPLHFVSDTGCRSPHRRCGYHRFHRSPYTARGHSDFWDRRW